uniref:acid phosphatase n=1 Tax=Strigamia maritima TaxID=126957 RepID=T1JEQ8_STRMM
MLLLSSFGFRISTSVPILFVNFLLILKADDDFQVQLVQILIRHGDRTPMRSFPTDQWKNAWPEGFGQLTKLGIQQAYSTGDYLRILYGVLINNTYNSETLHVQSTDTNRALMSASATLAGFLPPQGRQIWKKNLKWQPVPVHTMPEKHDYILAISQECPNYNKIYHELMKSPETLDINLKYKDLYKFLTDKTGMNVTHFNNASDIYDTLMAEQTHNLTLPDWVNKTILADLKNTQILYEIWPVKTLALRRLYGGPLVGEIVKNMQTSISDKTDQHKIYIFSAHDTTITCLLSALEVFDPQIPPYCSMVVVELVEKQRSYFVNLLYRNDTHHVPYELTLKGCSNPCPLDQFVTLTASVIPKDIQSECYGVV